MQLAACLNEVLDLERKQALAIGVAILVVGSVGAFVLWSSRPAPDVRIGYLTKDLHQLALRVALENGWFERDGVRVQLYEFSNGANEMDGFVSQIDMGYLGAAPAMVKRINNDIAVTLLAAVNLEGSAIMVSKEEYDLGHVTSIADLVGKGVMHPGPSTVQNFLLRLALNESGFDYSDITPVFSYPWYMGDQLTAATPAFIAWEPFCAQAEYAGNAVPLMLSGEIWPNHPCCVVAARNSFLATHSDIVQKVIDIHREAEEWIVANPTQALAIAVDWLEMDSGAVENAFGRIIYDYNLNRTGLERYLNFLIDEDQLESGKIPADINAFLDGFINTTFIGSP
jgi:NitT/TauT family transport system substrate-binding protein